jgi:serine/threonine-protein kinase RsbW
MKTMLGDVDGLQQREVVTYNVELAVYETCTNIVEHAYSDSSGRIEATVTLTSAPDRIVVDLLDTGTSFDIREVPDPTLNEPQVHGYGLFLVRELMDEIIYLSDAGGNHWRLVKELIFDA